MIRVLLVDDQRLVREGLQVLLESQPEFEVVGVAANGAEALESAERLRPDVVLMDVRMPVMDGVTATRKLRERCPKTRVIILTTFDDDEYVFEGLKAGALGYLLKTISAEEMANAVRTVAAGDALIAPSVTRKVVAELSRLSRRPLADQELIDPLTGRELEVLRAMAQGLSNLEIAERFSITEGTVKNHVSNILGKLGVRDRTQAVLRGQALKLI